MLSVALLLASAGSTSPVSVNTEVGTIEGVSADGVDSFLGLRYAAPPVRFAVAEEMNTNIGGKSGLQHMPAGTFGNVCQQDPGGVPDLLGPKPDEDCLFLNVWRPANTSEHDELPVLVYIHGGGFQFGAGSMRWNDGLKFAQTQNTVVVTLNYRLGPLGNFVHSEVGANAEGTGGLNGIYDQITALKYVQSNIHAFGGDKNRVTVFGISAGAMSTCILSVSPLAKGLFERAIMSSGPCVGPWGPGNSTYGKDLSAQMMDIVGVDNIADLRLVPANSVIWPDESVDNGLDFPGHFVDGWVLPERPELYWERGEINPKQLMIGAHSKDGTCAVYDIVPKWNATSTEYTQSVVRFDGDDTNGGWNHNYKHRSGAKVADAYPLREYKGHPSVAWLQADSDRAVLCPSHQIATHATNAGVEVYSFVYTMGDPTNKCPGQNTYMSANGFTPPDGAAQAIKQILADAAAAPTPAAEEDAASCSIKNTYSYHAAEMPYVFGTRAGPPDWDSGSETVVCKLSDDQERLSAAIMHYWATFARDGAPRASSQSGASADAVHGSVNSTMCSAFADAGQLDWPKWATKGGILTQGAEMQLDVRSRILYNVERKECSFWGPVTE
jgi:para-nitrobenzyl esterase